MRSLSFLAAGRLTSDPADGESYSTSFGSPFGSRPERIERHSCDASGQASIWEMNGTKLIGGGPVSPNPGLSWRAIGTGDFNGDGHSDILFQNTSGQASAWEMNGASLIGGGAVSPNPGASWRAVA